MSRDPLWGPVIDGPDLKVILFGAEVGFDFPELMISGNNIQSVQTVCTMDQNSMKAIPFGCVLDPGLVNRDIAVAGERQKRPYPRLLKSAGLRLRLSIF